ncbi:MAG: hypothetical protein HYX93_04855 [Chloroflexi bacterium]|nr:hypothetical protein [Chloroflexota bacterium]
MKRLQAASEPGAASGYPRYTILMSIEKRGAMKFFLLWVMTRIKERGWPKAEGLLRRRKVITEEAVIAATQDAVRIAITIGGSLPETARAIAITFEDAGQPISREDVDKWIDNAAAMGDAKMAGLSDIYPQWLRFCTITALSKSGNTQHFLWTGGSKYDMEDPEVNKMLTQSTAVAGIAMCRALRHPNEAQNLFHDSDALESTEPELQELVSGPAIYSGWLHMAEMLVSRFSEEEGLPRYEDLT